MASETEILSSPWPWPCDETQEYRSGGKQAECCGGGMAEGALRRVRLPQETRWAVTYVTCVTHLGEALDRNPHQRLQPLMAREGARVVPPVNVTQRNVT